MATYWLSFRIAHRTSSNGLMPRTYETRLKALNDAVSDHALTKWDDTTSFYVFSSNRDMDAIAKSIKGAIDTNIDLALIGSMTQTGGRLIGYTKDEQTLITLDGNISRS